MYMAIDQYGQTFLGLEHPRKDLCDRLGRSHVEKMYIDGSNGEAIHVGYIIGGLWLRLYRVLPFEETNPC